MDHFYGGHLSEERHQLQSFTGPHFFQDENAALVDEKGISKRVEVRLAHESSFVLCGGDGQWRSVLCLTGMTLAVAFLVFGAFLALSGEEEPTTPSHRDQLFAPAFKGPAVPLKRNLNGPRSRRGHRFVQSSSVLKEELEVGEVRTQNSTSPFCDTVACQRTAAFLEQQLDTTFSPCRNIYEYVCGRWQEKHAKTVNGKRRSRYSVDDGIVESYRKKLARRLSVDNGKIRPFRDVRSFYQECTRGKLTSREEIEEIKSLVELGSSPSVVALATTIVKMARIGFSPFFEVSLNRDPNVFRVKLLKPPTFISDQYSAEAWRHSYEAAMKQRSFKYHGAAADTSVTFNDTEHKLFLRLLGRIFCSEIVRDNPEADRKCSLDSASTMAPVWNYSWYKSNGMELLARYVEQDLESLLLEQITPSPGDDVDIRQVSLDWAEHRRRKAEKGIRDACLNIMVRHDPYLFSPWSAISSDASQTENIVKEALDNVVKVVNQRFPNSSDITMLYGLPALFKDGGTALSQYQNDLYAEEPQGSRLLRFLRNSTWKRWLEQQANRRTNPLSTIAAVSETTPTVVYVPESVFNLTAMKDPWLRRLAIARYAPRVLKTLFFERFSEELKTSRFALCASKYLPSDRDDDLYRQLDVQLGTEEIASFHIGLDLYRSGVGYHTLAVPGTDLDSDALFLFFYVYNQCEAVSKSPAQDQVMPLNERLGIAQRKRRLFPKISTIFAKVVLPGCKDSRMELAGCGVDDDTVGINETESVDAT